MNRYQKPSHWVRRSRSVPPCRICSETSTCGPRSTLWRDNQISIVTTTRESANMNSTQPASSQSLRQRDKRSSSFVLTGGRFCTGSFPLPSAEHLVEADATSARHRHQILQQRLNWIRNVAPARVGSSMVEQPRKLSGLVANGRLAAYNNGNGVGSSMVEQPRKLSGLVANGRLAA